MSKVSFISSQDRKYNIDRALSLIKGEVITGLKHAKKVVVKPNCVVGDNQLAATHKDTLDAILEFIFPHVKSQIILAEGSGIGETSVAFRNYNYFDLQEKYNFAFIDLNTDEFKTIKLVNKKGKEWNAQVAKTILESDYLISVTIPKTHDSVVYTGGVKNTAVGSLLRPQGGFAARLATKFGVVMNNKAMIHQGNNATNENIARLSNKIKVNLSVLDGFEAMQGNGPVNGEAYPSNWAIVSSDALAADLLAMTMMGIRVDDVGYLYQLSDDKKYEEPFIIGDDWKKKIHKFKMHSNFEQQRIWRT